MLRNVVDEVMRRRLWPILLAAVLAAVAAPLFFLESAPSDAPPATAAAPAGAPAGELPARARRLLATSEAPAGSSRRKQAARAGDPFRPPFSHRAARAAGSASGAGAPKRQAAPGTGSIEPVPVVVTNGAAPSATTSPTAPARQTAPSRRAATKAATTRSPAVDVRYSKRLPGQFRRSIPRGQTFLAGGRVMAVFVKYSPNRDKAVFAIAPRTLVTGDVKCRRKEGLCRYVDIPAGKHVRLTTLTAAGNLVSRRLDVVRTERARAFGGSAAAARTAPEDGGCLLRKLLTLTAHDSPLAGDACEG